MSGRPFAITVVGLWAIASAGIGAYQSWLTVTTGDSPRIALAVAALGGLIGVLLLGAGIGILRTSPWARSAGLLALGLATLVALVGTTIVENYVLAGALTGGNVLAFLVLFRNSKTFQDTDGRVEDVSAHLGR